MPLPRRYPGCLLCEALQPTAFCIKDLKEHQGGAIVFEMNQKGTPCSADPGDLAPASGHVDLARSDNLNLRSGRRGTAVSMLQPELKRPPRRDLEGEGGRKANPRSRRHGGVEHKLARGALGMDSRRNDAHRRDPPASTATLSVSLGAFFSRASMPPAEHPHLGGRGLAASSGEVGRDPLGGAFPSLLQKTGGLVPLA